MTRPLQFSGARIFDGHDWHDGKALVVEAGTIRGLVADDGALSGHDQIDCTGQMIVPGFIDLQVNGGGGLMFNDQPTIETIRTMIAAHARFGTTGLLPTLITDDRDHTMRAIDAGSQAWASHLPGYLGLHLEGPHLSLVRKGAHDPALIRTMTEDDLARLAAVPAAAGHCLITVAPESVTQEQIARLAKAGFLVSLGHTDCNHATAMAASEAGARCVTHLFNAMSPLGHREPGLVGAALANGALHAGLIADGIHVDVTTMAIALRAKSGPGHIFLVTDAMSTIGSDLTAFTLNGRTIHRKDGRLTLDDGTLAGADIDMIASVRLMHEKLGLPLAEALRMASLYPAEAIGLASRKGRLAEGYDADLVVLGAGLDVEQSWIGGSLVHTAEA